MDITYIQTQFDQDNLIQKSWKINAKTKLYSNDMTESESFLFQILHTYLSEFLTINDFALRIQLLNKRFYFIFDEKLHLLYFLAKKYYLDQDNPIYAMRKYFKAQFKKLNTRHDISIYQELHNAIETRIRLNKNLIKNHSGEKEFKHWFMVKSGGSKWSIDKSLVQFPHKTCFMTSYNAVKMTQFVFFEEFGSYAKELLKNGKGIIKTGCYVGKRRDYGLKYFFEVKIYQNEELLYEKKLENDDNNEFYAHVVDNSFKYVLLSTIYEMDSNNIPDRIQVSIGGKGKIFENGCHGVRFSNVFIICDLKENHGKKKNL